ncbi:MAG: winged helix-turn-helix domain-containing protein [Thermoplasmata archaeon]
MKVAIQCEIERSEESRYDHRLHGVLLVCDGRSCYEVAEILGRSPRTIQHWVNRFENIGFEGLREGERLGRPSRLDARQLNKLGKDLRKDPRKLGYSQNMWDGKLLSHHLSEVYGIELGVRQCQRLFRKLGFRRRKPRPVIAKADKDAQMEFRKTTKASTSR